VRINKWNEWMDRPYMHGLSSFAFLRWYVYYAGHCN